MSVSLKVKIFDSKGTQVLQVAKSTLTIGSASHCDVVLDHPSVNPEHTRAWLEGGRIWVQDLGSPSGTTLNEIRLPALKPMLVRDLDVLRLGECGSTLGLEPLLVRAPVVAKPKVNAPAPTSAHVVTAPQVHQGSVTAENKVPVRDLEIEKRREQHANLSRELAELRLQMQMAKLEKNSTQEMAQQLQSLGEEIRTVREQKAKWNETLRQVEADKQAMRKSVEAELAEFKTMTLKDLNTQREQDRNSLETWKKESVAEFNRLVRTLSVQKVKSWGTRPLTQSMVVEWETDLTKILRRVLFGEVARPQSPEDMSFADAETVVVHREPTAKISAANTGNTLINNTANITASRAAMGAVTSVGIPLPAESATGGLAAALAAGRDRARKGLSPSWKSLTITTVVLGVLMAGTWMGTAFMKKRGSRNLSSQAMEPKPVVVEHLVKVPTRFEPKQSRKFRSSYTDNVLYLENYVEAEENQDFRRRWIGELSKVAAAEWKIDQWSLAPLAAKERSLIQDLSIIKGSITTDREQEGISQMRAREAQFQKDLEVLLKNPSYVERFLKFKRSFYMRNQAYLVKQSN